MLTNKQFYDNNEDVSINCDICNKSIAIFLKDKCAHKVFIEGRIKAIYLEDGVYHCCSNECLKVWVSKNKDKLDGEVERKIPEDAYAVAKKKESEIDDTDEDISPLDGIEMNE